MTTSTTDLTNAPATEPSPLLRVALTLDAAVTAVNGVAYLAAAGPIGDLLGLEPALLRGAGAFLLAFACVVALAARDARPPRTLVLAIVAANGLWAAGSLVVAIAGWGDPSTVGTVWIALQAVVVGAFAELQLLGLRRRERR